VTVPETAGSDAPTLAEARSFSGRRLVELIIVIVAAVVVALHFHVLGTLAVVAAIVLIIVLHEFGHFVTAKLSKMKVTEFFVGFGPRVWSVHHGETEYGIKALPLGGYVRISGMTNLEEVPPEDEPRTYRQSTFPRRMMVSVAGSFMHFLMAFAILWVLLSAIGAATATGTVIESVPHIPGVVTPAQRAGLRPGEVVVAAAGSKDPSLDQFAKIVSSATGKRVSLVLSDHGHRVRTSLVPVSSTVLAAHDPAYRTAHPYGVIGVSIEAARVTYQKENIFSGAYHAFTGVFVWAWTSVTAILSHFTPHGIVTYVHEVVHPSSNVNSARYRSRFESPVGIVQYASYAAAAGIVAVLELLFSINVFVGVFNLFPFLPLDGGHVVIAIYERIRSRKGRPYHADAMKLLPLTYVVVTILLLLGATALYLDITHPIINPFR